MQAVLSARLHVGGDGTSVVVRLHHDQSGAKDHQEGEQIPLPLVADNDALGFRHRGNIFLQLFCEPVFFYVFKFF